MLLLGGHAPLHTTEPRLEVAQDGQDKTLGCRRPLGSLLVGWLGGPFHTWLQANGTDIQTLAVIGGVVAAAIGATVRWFRRSTPRRIGTTHAGVPPRTTEERAFADLLHNVTRHANDRIADALHLKTEVQGHHAAVCDAYLDEALRRKDYLPERGYTEAQTRRWLTRLAV